MYQTSFYDSKLRDDEQFIHNKEFLPWIGKDYPRQPHKFLLIGESHYAKEGDTAHRAVEDWYSGRCDKTHSDAYNTRAVIEEYLAGPTKGNTYGIFRNTDAILKEKFFPDMEDKPTAYTQIAFMNYFQRPADEYKKSIRPQELDLETSARVCTHVINTLTPVAVIFVSAKAYDAANRAGVFPSIACANLLRSTHPACAHWNMPKGGITTKIKFSNFVDEVIAPHSL